MFFTLFPTTVLALSSGGVGGYPANPDPGVPFSESWFIYNLDLGESKQDAVLVFNTTDEVKAVKLYAVDSTPSNQGNFALKGEDDPRVGIGAWIELSEEVIILEPGQSKEVAFTITIPEDADVGEHSGGIILQKADPSNVDAETGASIVTRVGIRVYQTVPGEITKDIELKDFSVEEIFSPTEGPMYEINVTAKNNGNVTLTPKARLEVTGWGKLEYFTRSNFNFNEGIVIDFKDLTDFFSAAQAKLTSSLMARFRFSFASYHFLYCSAFS